MEADRASMFGSSSRTDAIEGLRALALARGVSAAQFDQALAEGHLDLLAVDFFLLPGGPRKTGEEVSASSGIPLDQADRLWRALGFPEAGEEAAFNDQDVEALRTLRGLAELGMSSEETAVQVTRVLGQSMSRLAEALLASSDPSTRTSGRPAWADGPDDDAILLAQSVALSSELVFPNLERLLVYAWRRHLQAAARRRLSIRRDGEEDSAIVSPLTVGFADMVGFTALSSQLSAQQLARVVDRFEDLAHTTVVEGGGRPVKMIGDEVMFVADEPMQAVRIGLALVEAYADDDLLSDVRVGVAAGPVLTLEGDFFGPVVNRAHRIVAIADAGSVLASEEVVDAVDEDEVAREVRFQALKPRELKDLGRVRLWHVARAGTAPSERRRSGQRWRRLSEASPGLASLREQGERAVDALRAPAEHELPAPVPQAARIRPQGSAS